MHYFRTQIQETLIKLKKSVLGVIDIEEINIYIPNNNNNISKIVCYSQILTMETKNLLKWFMK